MSGLFSLPLGFAAPLALIGLLSLPVIWLLIRVTPPRPERTPFPPLRLILDLEPRDETPARTPWWLLLLRLGIAALACLAFSGPIWNPSLGDGGGEPLLVALDDGWAAAPTWDKRVAYAANAIEAAGRRGAPVAFVALSDGAREIAPNDASRALEPLRARTPRPFAPDRAIALGAMEKFASAQKNARALSDGLETGGARDFAQRMTRLFAGRLDIATDAHAPLALAGPRNEAGGLIARVFCAQAKQAAHPERCAPST